MSKNLFEMTNQELWELFPIILSKYNDLWPILYQTEKKQLIALFEPWIQRINHIGSTSVINLKAKPTIDILLEIKKSTPIDWFGQTAKANGYLFSFEQDNPAPSIMLKKGYTEQGFVGQAFHIHVRYLGDWDELYFRDYLQTHEFAQNEYVRLKETLFQQYEHDRDAYTSGKTEFIRKMTEFARAEMGPRYQP